MRNLILYFSGTGNTDYAARYLQKELKLLSIDSELCSIENTPPEKSAGFQLLTIGFPIYAGAPPVFFQRYLETLPDVHQKGLFLFCTRAMFTGHGIYNAYLQLRRKGYILLGHAVISMPGSDGMAFMRRNSKYVQKALGRDYSNIPEINEFARKIALATEDIGEGKSVFSIRKDVSKGIPVLNQVSQFLWSFTYSLSYNKLKSKFRADSRCVRCGLCVKQCPSQNIALPNVSVSFNGRCYLCMRCIHQCPNEAIQIGKSTVNKFRWKGPTGDFKPGTRILTPSQQ